MSTRKAAEAARDACADALRKAGAHAISVEQVTRARKRTWAVVASFEAKPQKPVPKTIDSVPVAVRIRPRFQPD